MMRALVFVVLECGYFPRSALELDDGGENRLQKIGRLIEVSKYGIHDLSNMELDRKSSLPRFNMPLELGLFLGAHKYGDKTQKSKNCLILDQSQYRYQMAISDISGQDIKSHDGDPRKAIRCVRDWLRTASRRKGLPGGQHMMQRHAKFESELPAICASFKLSPDELTFIDLWQAIEEWQKANLED